MSFDNQTLFGRKYRIVVGTGANAFEVSELHCTFLIEKSMLETPNYSEIVLYNLSAQTENAFIKEGQRVVIEAGYENDQYGLIFDGDIVQPLRGKEDNTTYTLTLICQDGDGFINNSIINKSFRAGQSLRSITNEITDKSTISAEQGEITDKLNDTKLSRGKVMFGQSKDYLRKIAKTEQAAFYINDGKVNIVKATDLPKGKIISLGPTSGLIGMPEQTNEGIKATCLLNPLLNLNSFVHIDNSLIQREKINRDSEIKQLDQNGVYRIIKLIHTGDTRGDSWYTEFVAITQIGEIPVTGNNMR